MARYSNFSMYGGGMSSCNINGRNISVINGDVYVDGVLYVPADSQGDLASGPFKPGKMVDHTFDVSSKFSSIETKGFIDVVFKQSDNAEDFGVRGHLPENLIERLDIHVSGDTLYIGMKPGNFSMSLPANKTPKIYVTNKVLKDVTASGSGDFMIDGDLVVSGHDSFYARSSGSSDFKAKRIIAPKGHVSLSSSGSGDKDIEGIESMVLMINISGSSNIDCGQVKTQICGIDIKGSGDVSISGETDTVEFNIAGSGDIRAGGFKAKSGKAYIAGSGDITCNVERLSDRVRGSGDVHNRW